MPPMVTPDTTHAWDAQTYDQISAPMTRMGTTVLDRLQLIGNETVLDAGCGSGRVTAKLLDRLPLNIMKSYEFPGIPGNS